MAETQTRNLKLQALTISKNWDDREPAYDCIARFTVEGVYGTNNIQIQLGGEIATSILMLCVDEIARSVKIAAVDAMSAIRMDNAKAGNARTDLIQSAPTDSVID